MKNWQHTIKENKSNLSGDRFQSLYNDFLLQFARAYIEEIGQACDECVFKGRCELMENSCDIGMMLYLDSEVKK